MQQRKSAPDALDYFPTPPFATRALTEFLALQLGDLGDQTCWEPAAGEMHMARPLAESFGHVRVSDVFPYDENAELFDFTQARWSRSLAGAADWVITNPPFRLAHDFIQTAGHVARIGFAMLVRTSFLEGGDRHAQLFSQFPPDFVLQFCERVVMLEGRLIKAGAVDPTTPDKRKASTATSYCWLVWIKGRGGDTRLRWIAPCRDRLERPGDYPDYADQVPPAADDGLFA
jgi:hypothetical protein